MDCEIVIDTNVLTRNRRTMKVPSRLITVFAGTLVFLNTSAQKPPIDTSVFNKWTWPQSPAISNDGNYFLYTIYNQPVGSKTLVVRTLKEGWKMEIPGAGNAVFTDNSKKVFLPKVMTVFTCFFQEGRRRSISPRQVLLSSLSRAIMNRLFTR